MRGSDWLDIIRGNDNYPHKDKDGDYVIAVSRSYRAQAVEFYGMNIWTRNMKLKNLTS